MAPVLTRAEGVTGASGMAGPLGASRPGACRLQWSGLGRGAGGGGEGDGENRSSRMEW